LILLVSGKTVDLAAYLEKELEELRLEPPGSDKSVYQLPVDIHPGHSPQVI